MEKNLTRKIIEVGIADVPEVGGKNASLGEMLQALHSKGVRVPDGFVTTASAFRYYMKETGLDALVRETLKGINTRNLASLHAAGEKIRKAIVQASLPKDLETEIISRYREMEKQYFKNVDVAVRSSATAEDLPGASFAGQQETYLNIEGVPALLTAVKKCYASLFTDRAISYRHDRGFDHMAIALSAGIQKMVRSDKGASGVMFSIDTESGFKDVALINGSWGLGEMIVQGEVIPDEFLVYKPFLGKRGVAPIISKTLGQKDRKMIYAAGTKPTKIISTSDAERQSFILSDEEILQLASWAQIIEDHYSAVHKTWTPMDMEWAKDGVTGDLFIVQARPETVQARKDFSKVKEYKLGKEGKVLTKGASVGTAIATGTAHIILSVKDIAQFKKGEALVTTMTDPDWEPIMKMASAIITDKGGRTSHAAIVSRELGIPCIVGTETATRVIKRGQAITVDTTGSEGFVYDGALPFSVAEHDVTKLPKLGTKIMVNIGTPESAFEKSFLPVAGVGLAREEFIIASYIGIHPMALVQFAELKKKAARDRATQEIVFQIEKKAVGYKDKKQFYVDQLSYGVAKIAAAFYPRPIIVRFSDFKTNEYRQLIGGSLYEPHEENPMIGWRGAARYYHPDFAPAFALEVEAIKKVREEMGLSNVEVMIPMCRTVDEGKKVVGLIEKGGLSQKKGLKIYTMCEIPANVLLADEFLEIFDGMSIGSNDLTQFTLALDRDGNERIRGIGNENNEAVKQLVARVIAACKRKKKYIGICGDAPSTFIDFARFLVDEGIESMSLSPDAVIPIIGKLGKK